MRLKKKRSILTIYSVSARGTNDSKNGLFHQYPDELFSKHRVVLR